MSFAPSAKSFASSLRHEFQFWGCFVKTNLQDKKQTGEKESSDRERQHQQSHVTNLLNLSHTRLQRAIFPFPFQHNQIGKKHNEKMK